MQSEITNRLRTIALLVPLLAMVMSIEGYSQTDSSQIKEPKKIELTAVPLINYDRSLGTIMGAMGAAYYKINKLDTISPSSSTTLLGVYTTNSTYMLAAIQQFYFKEDKWRVSFLGGRGDFFFQFYQGFGQWRPDEGRWIDFKTDIDFIRLGVKRKVFDNLYVGLEGEYISTTTTFDLKNPINGEDLSSSANMNNLGYNFLFDNRNNVNMPSTGYFVQFKNNFIREAFGASQDYDSYEVAFNYFWDVKKDGSSILVSRFFADIAAGDVPFNGQNVVGQDDLRGYSQGRYRAEQVYATQAELRQNIHNKFGMIAFLGVGYAVDTPSELSEVDLLPSAGLGFRYLMIPDEKINVGIDAGVGRDDWSLTFRIGETFGR